MPTGARPKALENEPFFLLAHAFNTTSVIRSTSKSSISADDIISGLSETFCFSMYFLSAGRCFFKRTFAAADSGVRLVRGYTGPV